MATRKFPQYLSKPFQVLWFEMDELLIFFFFLTLALIYKRWWLWVIFLVVQYSYTKTKRNQARGFLKHLLYALGLVPMKQYPDYFTQEFHE